MDRHLRIAILLAAALVTVTPAFAFIDDFADSPDGAKVHTASGFVCPQKIGPYERDAVGTSSLQTGAVFCAYSARDGVYGTVVIRPLAGAYEPKASLQSQFEEQSATGGQATGEATVSIGAARDRPPLAVYSKTYETTRLADNHYRVLYTGAAIANWAVETTIEYATPRDEAAKEAFQSAIYESALGRIAHAPGAGAAASPPLAGPARPR